MHHLSDKNPKNAPALLVFGLCNPHKDRTTRLEVMLQSIKTQTPVPSAGSNMRNPSRQHAPYVHKHQPIAPALIPEKCVPVSPPWITPTAPVHNSLPVKTFDEIMSSVFLSSPKILLVKCAIFKPNSLWKIPVVLSAERIRCRNICCNWSNPYWINWINWFCWVSRRSQICFGP